MDAWVFGAVDASSGTTVMMEIARVLGEKYKSGNADSFNNSQIHCKKIRN